jgi:hypothetical protein
MPDETDVTGEQERDPAPSRSPQKAPSWNPATQELLEDWHFRVTRAQFGHQLASERTRWRHLILGIPIVILTTVVGTGAFAAINEDTDNFWKVAAGTVSILAAVLASVQTFLGYGERSDRHRVAATRYANTRRSIELALTSHDADAVLFIKGEMDRVGGASPQIDERTWKEARALAREAIASWRRGERHNIDDPAPRHAAKRHTPTSPTEPSPQPGIEAKREP